MKAIESRAGSAPGDVKSWLNRVGKSVTVTPIPGDASSRRYFRVRSRTDSWILMRTQPFIEVGEQLPFIQVQRHLERLKINVPKIVDLDARKGFILLSDLGDETLLKRLERVSKQKDQFIWFRRAIDLLVETQIAATRTTAPIDAYGLYFDEEKLMWEVGFTLAHFYNGVLAREVSAKDLTRIQTYFQWMCRELASQEWFFTHRDYHSRNVMVVGDSLYLIDFQDARLGCAQYDLASLLRDSYYQLDEELVYDLVEYYLKTREKMGFKKENLKEFTRVFDLMAVQRNFKAIGSFASFYMKRSDARYLKFIGNTFENIRRNLLKRAEFDELRCLLFRYYYF